MFGNGSKHLAWMIIPHGDMSHKTMDKIGSDAQGGSRMLGMNGGARASRTLLNVWED
jgi:hypothetical protein